MYTKTLNSLLVLIGICSIQVATVRAQTNCTQIVQHAQQAFEEGNLKETCRLLQTRKVDCSPKEEVQALQLLTYSYVFLHQNTAADSTYEVLLRKKPHFTPNTAAWSEFKWLTKRIQACPSLILTGGGALTAHNVEVIQANTTNNNSKTTYLPQFNGSMTVGAYMQVVKKLELGVVFHWQKLSYQLMHQPETFAPQSYTWPSLRLKETTQGMSVQLDAKYALFKGKYHYYVGSGLGIQRLWGHQFSSSHWGLQGFGSLPIASKHRRQMRAFAQVHAEIRYPIQQHFVYLKGGVQYSPTSLTTNAFSHSELQEIHQDDTFALHTAFLEVGFHYFFYRINKTHEN